MASATDASEAAVAKFGPQERSHFKEMLLADHFKGIAAPTGGNPPVGNTSYEKLACVGYQPQLGQLNAVVNIKQSSGYDGSICTAGSQEYVAFYLSTDDGATWTALGTTSFTTWDITGVKPLEFDVTLPVDLPAACCQEENIVLIRAILSWEVPPSGPTSPVVWGNGLDVHVHVAPLALGTIEELFECLHVPIEPIGDVVNLDQVVEFGTGKQLTPLELHEAYKDTQVPQHRYLLDTVGKLLENPTALGHAASQANFELLPGVEGVELGPIIAAMLDPQGNETYEQLGCAGLNTSTYSLVATVEVKLPTGYSGSLCTNGSNEYVAFWADWGSGYEYVGTTSVNVHDIAAIPAGGLEYAVALPFPQALTNRRPCADGPVIVPIRAVLSWSALPSDTDPYAVPVWGGHLEATVLIPPGEAITGGGPVLDSIASMPLLYIDPVSGLATGQSTVGFYATGCPFGGSINFSGWVINPSTGMPGGPGIQYRILVSPNNGATYTPMTEAFSVVTTSLPSGTQNTVVQHPDVNGWCDYLANFTTPGSLLDVVQNILGYWTTSGDGQLWISMEAQQSGLSIGATPWKLIQLDNTAPAASVEITSGGGSCGDFEPGALVTGTYSASDNEDLSSVTIAVEMPMPGVTMKQMITAETLSTESGSWSLQTLATTEPCGYTITATAVDNTIVDSGAIGWQGYGYTGLCLRPTS